MEQQGGGPENPFAPPQAEVADVAAGDGLLLATRGNRLLAAAIDLIIQLAAMFVVNLALPFSIFRPGGPAWVPLVGGLVGIGVWLALQSVLLVRHGQTVGKRAMGLRIVRRDGRRVGAGRILGLRYGVGWAIGIIPVVGVIYGLIDSLLIFRESRRCLHDQIADTIVVRIADRP